jgi:hypothetical protein
MDEREYKMKAGLKMLAWGKSYVVAQLIFP